MHPSQLSDMLIDQNMNRVEFDCGNRSNQENKRNQLKENLVQSDRVTLGTRAMSSKLHPTAAGHNVKLKNNLVKTPAHDDKPDTQPFNRLKSLESETQVKTEDSRAPAGDEEVINGEITNCHTEEEDPEDLTSPDTVQKRVCLVKLYAWLKDEISKTAAKAIANHLYQHEARLLSRADHEAINHSKWRRETVEMLLKKVQVLMGPDDVNEAFIEALKSQEEDHIVNKLENTHVTDTEIELFTQLELSSLNRGIRPDSGCPRLKISSSDNETLLFYLNNKNTIDCVNDQFLSKFYFSIREHTNICVCRMDSEARVRTLIDTMKLCADKLFSEFCDILGEIEMGHVISKLERRNEGVKMCKQRKKRKSSGNSEGGNSNDEVPTSSSAKRQCVDPSIEYRLVSSMQRSASNLRLHSLEQFGFDVEAVNKGSIVIQLSPQTPDSWKRLEDNCLSGHIKDFIPKVYDNAEIYDMLKEGEYKLQFTIYTLPSPPDTKEAKKVMFHLETDPGNKKEEQTSNLKSCPSENHIEEHMDLLCEELEIDNELLGLLKSKKLVEDNIKEQVSKQGSRQKRIKFLMKKISAHGNKGYEVLKKYIKDNNEDLYQELVNRDDVKHISDTKLEQAAKVTKESRPSSGGTNRKEVFFSGTVILKVSKTDKDSSSKDKSGKGKLDISCTEIVNPVCHFLSEGEADKPKSGEITMVLEDSWVPVGQRESPKRDILVGKRKTRDKKTETAEEVPLKRYHSTEAHSSDEDSSQDLASDLRDIKEIKEDQSRNKEEVEKKPNFNTEVDVNS